MMGDYNKFNCPFTIPLIRQPPPRLAAALRYPQPVLRHPQPVLRHPPWVLRHPPPPPPSLLRPQPPLRPSPPSTPQRLPTSNVLWYRNSSVPPFIPSYPPNFNVSPPVITFNNSQFNYNSNSITGNPRNWNNGNSSKTVKKSEVNNSKNELVSYKTSKPHTVTSGQNQSDYSKKSYNKKPESNYGRSKSPCTSRTEYTRSSNSQISPSTYRPLYNSSSLNKSGQTSYISHNNRSSNERNLILTKWRENYCSTSAEVSNRIQELSKVDQNKIIEQEKLIWTKTSSSGLYYKKNKNNSKIVEATPKLIQMCNKFHGTLVLRATKANVIKPIDELSPRTICYHLYKPKSEETDSSSEDELTDQEDCTMEELQRKQQHPDRLHSEMWHNDLGELNDGPLCRCSMKSRKSGIRHGIYPGEKLLIKCNIDSNNAGKLYHYRITISPPTNFLIETPTIIRYDQHEFIFEGFSMFSHVPLVELPTCKVIRFNIEYTILYIEEKSPENFTIRELDLFYDYLFKEILELVDLDFKSANDLNSCSLYHFMPRFVRDLPNNGKEILSMNEVLKYLLRSSIPLIQSNQLKEMMNMNQFEWQRYVDDIKGMVVTYPGKKPCSIRVDQLDRNSDQRLYFDNYYYYPEIVHFGIRPPQLSYAGNPDYQEAWKDYVKFRHLLANMSKPTFNDKRNLETKEKRLQEMRTQGNMKRDVTVTVSAKGFYRTGIMCDIIQHAMLIPVLVCHLRFHHSLNVLEESLNYKFKNRSLLQLALTDPSYNGNFGTNSDHVRNSLTNCGIRQPENGDRRLHCMNSRKRGINTLTNIMSRFGKQIETESNITHNERLEFLGDAVVEFLSSIHLFYTFPDLKEYGLAIYRAGIVQNQHLSILADKLKLDEYMLYAHGSDLCLDLELRHAMANCFKALMGALYLDGGIKIVDRVFSETLYKEQPGLLNRWINLPPHPLQEQEPTGDRQWIPKFELLQKLTKFEEFVGLKFNHIRLLARAFIDCSVGFTNLTLGSNQRLKFLGDTIFQLIASEYLYKFFPEHHEGHLSLLRNSLVNNRTQAVVCDDLGMSAYAIYGPPKTELKIKDRANLLEAFIGALYVDKDLEFCQVFCQVTLFPRLRNFIMNQNWNDSKSKLQQCCLTLRTVEGEQPDIPVYKIIECKGPTNTRVYTVAVYFRGKRLASGMGHSIQQAEMNAAKKALEKSHDLFPQLDHQKRVIEKNMKTQKNQKIASPPTWKVMYTKRKPLKSYSKTRFNSRGANLSVNNDSSSYSTSSEDE